MREFFHTKQISKDAPLGISCDFNNESDNTKLTKYNFSVRTQSWENKSSNKTVKVN